MQNEKYVEIFIKIYLFILLFSLSPINFNTTTCVICGISGPNDLKQDVIFHFNLEIGHMGCCKQKVHHYCADKL
jgi:hypothetical protein